MPLRTYVTDCLEDVSSLYEKNLEQSLSVYIYRYLDFTSP